MAVTTGDLDVFDPLPRLGRWSQHKYDPPHARIRILSESDRFCMGAAATPDPYKICRFPRTLARVRWILRSRIRARTETRYPVANLRPPMFVILMPNVALGPGYWMRLGTPCATTAFVLLLLLVKHRRSGPILNLDFIGGDTVDS